MENPKVTRIKAPVLRDRIQIELSLEQARCLRHMTCFINTGTDTDKCSHANDLLEIVKFLDLELGKSGVTV